jgi:hemolysin activation/secretion protein
MVTRTAMLVLAACLLAGAGFNALAQAPRPAASAPRMDISGYGIEGNRLLNAEDFTRIIGPLIGRGKTAADVERTRATMQQAYYDLGHCDVRVGLASPAPDDGIIMFRLTEIPAAQLKDCLPKVELAGPARPVAVAGAAAAPILVAQAGPPAGGAAAIPAPRFDINRFQITGNTLIPQDQVDQLVAPYTGKDKDFADIQRALETLEREYRDRGFGVVQVQLPEQDITKGIVQLRVLQPRVGRVLIEGNTHFDNDNVRRSLPTVKEGETPNSRDMARNLQITGEHPTKQTNVLLRSGASEDQVDVNVKVTDEKPWRVFLTADNTGTKETGYYRTGLGFQHSNLFNRDHTLTAQYVTSPTEADKVSIYGGGYRIPFYDLNSSFDLIAGYSDVDSGVVQGLFNVSGKGTIGIMRWSYYLPRLQDLEHKVALGIDYRKFENQVLFTGAPGSSVVPDIIVKPVSLTYSALWRGTASELSFFGSYAANIAGGTDGDDAAFELSRTGADANYTVGRAGFNYVYQFRNEWQTRLTANGQYSSDLLVSGEQYGIGGPDSVRGYLLREAARDKGYAAQAELYTPDFGRAIGLPDSFRLRLLGFFDYGAVRRNDEPLPGETTSDSLKSAGVGLRFAYKKSLSVRFDVANIRKETGNREEGDWRGVGAVAIIF